MRNSNWWPFQRRVSRHTQESGAALFRGLRIRLTLWYCGVLVAALVIFGVALYIGTQFALLKPVQDDTQRSTFIHAQQWLSSHDQDDLPGCPLANSKGQPGQPGPGQGVYMPEMVICFDANGALLTNQITSGQAPAFLNNSVALQALHSPTHCASDIVNVGGSFGRIYRYATVVVDPASGSIKGVVVTGGHIEAQYTALSTLLMLLLSIGGGALLCAGLGGLFLAHRALAPARLAWANQQRFIADASHELRTPLTLMRADAEVLLRGRKRMDAEDAGLLEDIVVEVNHMSKITTNLLTLARLDNQFAHREHEVVSLAQLAGSMVRRVEALASQRNITIQENYTGNPYVIGDPTLLEQAVLVLLDNAIKYNQPGGSIGVYTVVKDERALLEVRDSGIGITAEHLPYLGERFYRADKARSRAAGGTGLGLSIARSIASTHGGQLTLTSQPDQGTIATLSLPLAHEARTT
jgi:signal transduction histidine kinase